MPPKGVRDLKKRYAIGHRKTYGDRDEVLQRGRRQKHRFAIGPEGKEYLPDRRRMNPSVAGKLGTRKSIKGTAKKLYLNLGVDKRGTGGRGRRRSKH